MSRDETGNILIDLSESLSAACFKNKKEEGERLLQRPAREQVKRIIRNLLDKAMGSALSSSLTTDGAYPRSHDVITINGGRGSGKTTFILNILELVSSEECFHKNGKAQIRSLGIIDPTLLEDCAHIFLAVVSKIKEAVEKHWEDSRVGLNGETVDGRYQQWRESLTRLAGGLRYLGKKKDMDGDAWADPQFIMEEGLENAAQGVKLEWHFHCFVEDSLRFIGKDAFILALDDVDTKADTGWPVLEVLRKYLTSSRLIIILSGDIELYTQLIFSQQCKQTGVDLGKIIEKTKDSDGQTALDYLSQRKMVDDLTEQYMMKILRPDYRIEMQTVAQISKQLKRAGGEIKVRREEKGQVWEIGELLEKFCEEIYGSSFQKGYLALVLTEVPTRTCIQLLNAATLFLEVVESAPEKENEQAHLEAVASLGHVFQNALALAGLPSKLVNEVEAQNYMTLGRVSKALYKNDLLAQGFYLFPDQALAWQRQLMMVLAAVYTRLQTKQPSFPFGYLVSMCLPAYLQRILPDDNFKKYLIESRLETEQEAINVVRRGIKLLLLEPASLKRVDIGKDKAYPQMCAITVGGYPVTASWHRYLLNMISVFVPEDNISRHYISFYALFGAIATLSFSIKKPKNEDRLEDDEETEAKRTVSKIFRQYGGENNLKFGESSIVHGTVNESKEVKESKEDEFCLLFAQWCYTLPKKPAPLLVIPESWSRFEEIGTRLVEKYSKDPSKDPDEKENTAGFFLQNCIIYYLSNLLEHEMSIVGIATGNDKPNTIERKFANLLNAYFKRQESEPLKCRLFEYIFSCPIWMHFIDMFPTGESNPHVIILDHYINSLRKVSPEVNRNDITNIASFKVSGEDKYNLFRLLKGTKSNKTKQISGSPEAK